MTDKNNRYDIIVIGGGHAGIEASYAAARMGCKVGLVTMNKKAIGRPSCNPSIGGTAKGHLVKEIDALGGAMGFLADRAGIQFKMLNKSKGPAIWSPRCQIDKDLYPIYAYDLLNKTQNLDIIEADAEEITIKNYKITGLKLIGNIELSCDALVFTPGTFLNGVMFTGLNKYIGGRFGEKSSVGITEKLVKFGFETGRLKTGTPPRIHKDSIDYSKIELAQGDKSPVPFSYRTSEVKNSIMCYMTSTNKEVHDVLKTGFDESPMFTGMIHGTGPRYCPSIEDKINRFSNRDSHKILLEPEGLNTNSVYVNGFSTSLPLEIQQLGLRKIPGLENCNIIRAGYAVEYDFFYPYQLKFSFESKLVENLFFAGQINGTSGYEEAAAQGFMAGVNAALKIKNQEPLILKRSESYIGVLADDLVNKSTEEPYRMFTSLAEYRLILRQDNSYERLMKYGNKLGLVPDIIFELYENRKNMINYGFDRFKNIKLKSEKVNSYLKLINETETNETLDIFNLTKRSSVQLNELIKLINEIPEDIKFLIKKSDIIEKIQLEIKYEGYINRQLKEIEYFLQNEEKIIPDSFDYRNLNSLSNESREKLMKIKPRSLGQASRISGVTASDISIISLYLR